MASGFNVAINIVPGAGIAAAQRGLGGVGDAATKAQVKVSGLTGTFRALENVLRALPIAFLVREVARATQEFDRIHASLRVATGSAAGGAREFKFIAEEAQRLGLSLTTAAGEYAKLAAAARGTALAGEPARKLFTATSEAATALGLSADETAGALRAFQQMISKGTVSAEELRGQLGERIPGAFQMAARAMGVTTEELDKMLRAGSIAAEDLLPKLAEEMHKTFGPEAERNAHSLTAEINRLNTELKLLAAQSSTGGATMVGVFAGIVRIIREDIIPALRAFNAFMSGAVLRTAQLLLSVFMALPRLIAVPFEILGKGLEKLGVANPFANWIESINAAEAEAQEWLGQLAEWFFEIAREQASLVGQETRLAEAATTVADEAGRAAANTNDLAAAATRARDAFAGIAPGQLAGAVPVSGSRLAQPLAPLDERILDQIEADARRLGEQVFEPELREIEGRFRITFRNIGRMIQGAFKEIRADIVSIMAGALSDIVTGVRDSTAIMQDVIVAGFTAAGAAVGAALSGGSPQGAQAGAAIGGLIGELVAGLFGGSKPFAAVSFAAQGGELAALDQWANKRGDLDAITETGEQLTGAINDILRGLGATLEGLTRDIGFIVRNGNAIVNIDGVQRDFGKNMQAAVEFFILEVIKSAELSGLSENVISAIKLAADQAGGDMAKFQRDLGFIQEIEGIGKGALATSLEALTKHFANLKDAAVRLGLDLEKVTAEEVKRAQALKDAAVAAFGDKLLSFVDQYYGQIQGGEEFRAKLEELNFNIRIAQLRMEFEALQAVGALSAEMLAMAQEVFAFIDANPPEFGGGGRAGREQRRAEREAAQQARRDFRDALRLLELAASGASDGVVELARQIQDLDRFLEEQRAAGVRGTGRFRDLTLQGLLDDALAPVREILGPTSEADRIRQHYADVRAQVTLLAAEMGVAVGPLLALVDQAEQSELTRITQEAADAERELTEERRRQVQALEDLTAPDFVKRLRDLWAQIEAAVGGGREGSLPGGSTFLTLPDPAAIAAGQSALQALGRDFLQSLQQMGIVIPGLNRDLAEFNRVQALASANALLMAGAITTAQWQAATDGINGYFDAIVNGTDAAAQAADVFAEHFRAMAETMEQRAQDFASMWKNLMGGGDDPVKKIEAEFDALRKAFLFLSPEARRAHLQSLGLDPGGTAQQQLATLESLIGPAEAEAIANAIADVLQPIRDFFEDLRVSGAGLTQTQRFNNAFTDFQAALAANNIPRAVELARMLTGDLGVGQFGSSSEAFRGLTDFIINALGGKLPEGPPEDLLGQRTADATERAAAGIDRLYTVGQQQNTILENGFRDLSRRVDNLSARIESGYVH